MSSSGKKLQVFISSTYEDMKEERQAAVQAVLEAGHIPAGMELFASGDESQIQTIRRWIDDSDVFLLILGGRYGTIEEKSQKSYIELEFEHAIENSKPHFSVAINEDALEEKVRKLGTSAIEKKVPAKLTDFRAKVLSRTSSFYNDTKDIKLSIIRSLSEKSRDDTLTGWMRENHVASNELLEENRLLRKALTEASAAPTVLEVGINFPELPEISDEIFVTMFPRGYYGGPIVVSGTWADFFPLFASSLVVRTSDWNNEFSFVISDENSRSAIAAAILAALKSDNPSGYDLIKVDFDRLCAFFVEAGLLADGEGTEPFTSFGRKLSCRVKISIADFGKRLKVVEGKLPSKADEEIPF